MGCKVKWVSGLAEKHTATGIHGRGMAPRCSTVEDLQERFRHRKPHGLECIAQAKIVIAFQRVC